MPVIWDAKEIRKYLKEDCDSRDVSYCLRLLGENGVLSEPAMLSKSQVLRDMAGRLKISAASILSDKQAKYAAALMLKGNFDKPLVMILNRKVRAGEEVLLGDMSSNHEILEDPPAPQPEKTDSVLNPNWGMF